MRWLPRNLRRFLDEEWLLLDAEQRTRGRTTTRAILFHGQQGECWQPGRRHSLSARRMRTSFYARVGLLATAVVAASFLVRATLSRPAVLASVVNAAPEPASPSREPSNAAGAEVDDSPPPATEPMPSQLISDTLAPTSGGPANESNRAGEPSEQRGAQEQASAALPLSAADSEAAREIAGVVLSHDARKRLCLVFEEPDGSVLELRYDDATDGLQDPALYLRAGERVELRATPEGRIESLRSRWKPPAAPASPVNSNRTELEEARRAKNVSGEPIELFGRVVDPSQEFQRFFLADPSQATVDWSSMLRTSARLDPTSREKSMRRAIELVYRDEMQSPNVTDFLDGYRWLRSELPRTLFFDEATRGREKLAEDRLVRIEALAVEPAWAGLYVTSVEEVKGLRPATRSTLPSWEQRKESKIPQSAHSARERWGEGDHEGALRVLLGSVRGLKDARVYAPGAAPGGLRLVGGSMAPLSSVESFDWHAPRMICQWKQHDGVETHEDLEDIRKHLETVDVEFGFRLRKALLLLDADWSREPEILLPQTAERRFLRDNRGVALLAELGVLPSAAAFEFHAAERGERFERYWRGREAASQHAQSYLEALATASRELVTQLYSSVGDSVGQARLAELTATWEERDALLAGVGFAADPPEPLAATDLAKALPEGTAVVDFVSYIAPLGRREQLEIVRAHAAKFAAGTKTDLFKAEREHLEHTLGAFVIVRDHPVQLVRLGSLQRIEEGMRRLQACIAGHPSDEDAERRKDDEALIGDLWRRLEGAFGGARTVILRPDTSVQASFPFAALSPNTPTRQLLDDYALILTPSLPYLRAQLARTPTRATGRAMLVGGPADFAPYEPLLRPGVYAQLKALPDADEEMRDIEGILNAAGLDSRRIHHASKREVLATLAGASVLHVAAHGFPDALAITRLVPKPPVAPPLGHEPFRLQIAGKTVPPQALAGIVLSGEAGEPGLLTGIELENLPLQGMSLAVLSSCSSALGGSGDREGEALALGLQRSLHLAGCETVVASLWPVSDLGARLLMTEFYKNWLELGLSRIDALRQAQLNLRGHASGGADRGVGGVTLDAADWAAFTLSGIWEESGGSNFRAAPAPQTREKSPTLVESPESVGSSELTARVPPPPDAKAGPYRMQELRPGRSDIVGFGSSLALRKGRALVGSPQEGAVYLFEQSSKEWTLEARIAAPPGPEADSFGSSVAWMGDRVVVGASRAGPGGIVRLYEKTAAGWSVIDEARGQPGWALGRSLAGTPDAIAAGAPGAYRSGGAVLLGRWQDGKIRWTELVPDSESGEFGGALGFATDQLVVGAPRAKPGRFVGGAVHVYKIEGQRQPELRTIIRQPDYLEEEPVWAAFGGSLAAHGNDVVVGATDSGYGSGEVFVLDLTSPDPAPKELKAGARLPGDEFGKLVAVAPGLIIASEERPLLTVFESKSGSWEPNYESRWSTDLPKMTALVLDESGLLIAGERASLVGQPGVRVGEVYWMSR